jgi:hypothetical protein
LYFLSGNCSTFQFYNHQAGLAKPAGYAVSCLAATASHLSQSLSRNHLISSSHPTDQVDIY